MFTALDSTFEQDSNFWSHSFCTHFLFYKQLSLLGIETEKSQKTKQLLRKHRGSNETPEFCNEQNEKKKKKCDQIYNIA